MSHNKEEEKAECENKKLHVMHGMHVHSVHRMQHAVQAGRCTACIGRSRLGSPGWKVPDGRSRLEGPGWKVPADMREHRVLAASQPHAEERYACLIDQAGHGTYMSCSKASLEIVYPYVQGRS